MTREQVRSALRVLLALGMTGIGVMHFVRPQPFVDIVPPWLPMPVLLVYVSGFFEVALGLALLPAKSRKLASYGLVALYIAVFPANLHMALNDVPLDGEHVPRWALYARLPMQLVLIVWALWVGREPRPPVSSHG